MAYFTIAEARALKPLDNATTYPDATITAGRLLAEEALEDACGVAFEPRTYTETVSADGGDGLLLSWPRVTAVTAISVDGTAYTSTELAAVKSLRTGGLYGENRWASGTANVVVTYTHGYTTPPQRVKQAALILTRAWLVKGPVDDRATQYASDAGTINLATPGVQGSTFGIPEVDEVVKQYGLHVGIG